VLELSLIVHALVHEYHQQPAVWQNDLDNLKEKMDTLMTSILTKIYQGDDGIDAATCKCHSHYHIIDDIRYFGDPMGYNASTGERNLKWWAKRISKTARTCGQTIFLEQTSKRVSDQLVLQRAYDAMIMIDENKTSRNQYTGQGGPWFYSRKEHHLMYNPITDTALYNEHKGKRQPGDPMLLLTQQIRQVLKDTHGPTGEIRIWKEIILNEHNGVRTQQSIRAFHDFDEHGKFFDWVHVKEDDGRYVPAKVVLLYQTNLPSDHALVWKSLPATDHERQHETNLSARWKVSLLPSGLPSIVSIPTSKIDDCIMVHPHWKCTNGNHIPSTPIPSSDDTSMFVIDELYDRYSWLLNYVDDD
jgi:hypothetical protein